MTRGNAAPAPETERFLQELAGSRSEASSTAWSDLRRRAGEALTLHGLPGRDTEAFRFSAPGDLTGPALAIGGSRQALRVEGVVTGATVLTVVNGAVQAPGVLPAGLRVVSLKDAPEAYEPQTRKLGSLVSHEDGWVAANSAGFDDGYLVLVEAGKTLPSPIELVFVQGDATPGGTTSVSLPRVLIVLEAGAHAELVERHISVGDSGSLSNGVIEILVGDEAELKHSRWVNVGDDAHNLFATAVALGAGADYCGFSLSSTGRYVRHDLSVHLRGRRASTTLDGLYYGRKGQLVDQHVRVWHEQPEGTTRECYRGVIENGGRGVFDGIVYVRPLAMKTDARQENRNLLLGPQAMVNAKPHLEIEADDVSCSHGATVGQLDEAQLFYLRARGIEETRARELLIWAFAKEIVERCPNPQVARLASQALAGASLEDWDARAQP